MNTDAIIEKRVENKIIEEKIIINSIIDDKIISFFENPKILNIKF